jgi:hypothetical protein
MVAWVYFILLRFLEWANLGSQGWQATHLGVELCQCSSCYETNSKPSQTVRPASYLKKVMVASYCVKSQYYTYILK